MRKFLILTVLALVFAVPSFAAVHLGVNGGYSYSSLENLNTYWEKVRADAEANSFSAGADWKGYGNGVFGNIDLGINLAENFLVEVRTGLQYIFPSTYTGFRLIDLPPPTWMTTETSIDNFLIPIMAGINLYLPLGDKDSAVAVTAGAYGGWGLAYCAQSTRYNGSSPMLALYGGNGFMADLSASVEMKLLPFLTISLNGGYRFANMSNFKSVSSVSATIPGYGLYTISSNDPFNDESGKPVNVDFSGINIGIGVNIRI